VPDEQYQGPLEKPSTMEPVRPPRKPIIDEFYFMEAFLNAVSGALSNKYVQAAGVAATVVTITWLLPGAAPIVIAFGM
jgi:hypothetical protein